MDDEEAAWCMREFLTTGRSQHAIGVQVGWKNMSTILMQFYEKYGSSGPEFTHIWNYELRRNEYFRDALERYKSSGHGFKFPNPPPPRPEYWVAGNNPWMIYAAARREHAWLLRAEGLTYREIGQRLGCGPGRTRELILSFGLRVAKAIKRVRIRIADHAPNAGRGMGCN